tara:strand:- start:1885 stop:2355 length:471 start_codon:yes stop_codon:yes gene_type:complete
MHLTIRTNQFDIHNVMISDKTKNNIMNNSDFYRIYYSNENFTLSGVCIFFSLNNIVIEKYFNKIKCNFEESSINKINVQKIKNIEKMILEKYDDINNKKIFRIDEQLSNKFLKLFDENILNIGRYETINFQLKISGIWSQSESNEYGLTFRFFVIK